MNTQHSESNQERKASIVARVADHGGSRAVLSGASVALHGPLPGHEIRDRAQLLELHPRPLVRQTNRHGIAVFDGLEPGRYALHYLNRPADTEHCDIQVGAGETREVSLQPQIDASITTSAQSDDCRPLDCRQIQAGDNVLTRLSYRPRLFATIVLPPGTTQVGEPTESSTDLAWVPMHAGRYERIYVMQLPLAEEVARLGIAPDAPSHAEMQIHESIEVRPRAPIPVTGKVGISLTRSETEHTADVPLWLAIRSGTDALSFHNYLRYMDLLFSPEERQGAGSHAFTAERKLFNQLKRRRYLPFTDTDAYRVLKAATEAFVMVNCAVLKAPDFDRRDDNSYLDRRDLPPLHGIGAAFERYLEPVDALGRERVLPYLALVRRKLPDIPITEADPEGDSLSVGFVQDKLSHPCMVELIWSYWLEEAMLVQTMNAITRRFQNIRSPGTPDPLGNLEIDPLRPLNNLIWGYTQDEQHRLTVNRRNYEYDHQYGMRLQGRAIRSMRPADTRSQFLESFHHLLRLCTVFFKQDDDTTVKADAFPVLNALKEVHLVMSQGAHNQFGDLPSTARIEMLMQQWLLARPEFREFLPTRIMVAYPEPWMDRVDAMKKIQGWTDTSVIHFRNLAIFGEQLLLSIRYGAWSEIFEPTQAFNWARFWRPQIQGYNHAFWAATGVELNGEKADKSADATPPSLLLQKRLAVQQRGA